MLTAMIAALFAASMTAVYAQTPEAQVTPSAAHPGDAITITGSGFQPTETVTVIFGDGSVASAVVDAGGFFELVGAVPAMMLPGFYTLDVFGSLGSYAQADYEVLAMAPPSGGSSGSGLVSTPAFVASPPAARAGDDVTITGTAFGPGESVEVVFGGEVIAVATAGDDGSFVAEGRIAIDMPAGTHPLDVIGSDGSAVTNEYEVLASEPVATVEPELIPAITLSPLTAAPGELVTIMGTGFMAGESAQAMFGGVIGPVTVVGDDGSFLATMFIPADMPAGSHPLDVYGSAGTMITVEYLVLAPALTVVTSPTAVPTVERAPAPASDSDTGTTSTGPATSNADDDSDTPAPTTSSADDDSDTPTPTTTAGPTVSSVNDDSGTSTSNSGSTTGAAGSGDSSAEPDDDEEADDESGLSDADIAGRILDIGGALIPDAGRTCGGFSTALSGISEWNDSTAGTGAGRVADTAAAAAASAAGVLPPVAVAQAVSGGVDLAFGACGGQPPKALEVPVNTVRVIVATLEGPGSRARLKARMDSGALGGLTEFLSHFGTGLGEWGFDIWNGWFGDDVPPPPDNSGSLPMLPQEGNVPLPVLGAEATPDEGVELFWGGSHIGTWDASTGEVTMEDGWDLMLDGGLIQAIEGAVAGMDGTVTGFGGAVPGYAP